VIVLPVARALFAAWLEIVDPLKDPEDTWKKLSNLHKTAWEAVAVASVVAQADQPRFRAVGAPGDDDE
jgi:hypothetical protein